MKPSGKHWRQRWVIYALLICNGAQKNKIKNIPVRTSLQCSSTSTHSELCPTDFTLLPFMPLAFISLHHHHPVFTFSLFSSLFFSNDSKRNWNVDLYSKLPPGRAILPFTCVDTFKLHTSTCLTGFTNKQQACPFLCELPFFGNTLYLIYRNMGFIPVRALVCAVLNCAWVHMFCGSSTKACANFLLSTVGNICRRLWHQPLFSPVYLILPTFLPSSLLLHWDKGS